MTTQLNPVYYAEAIQYQLSDIVDPVPVYANFNRNYATEPQFLTWHIRDIHQPVFTGQNQDNKGIDSPTFQISVFAKDMSDAFNLANDILQSLHGYSGMFGNPDTTGFFIAKADVMWLYNSYDNEIGMHQIFLDSTIYVPA
jgi:hypothetical protein